MTTGRDDTGAPPTFDDLRRLEARVDARLHEITARLVMHDGRFAAMADRITQTDRRADALSARIDGQFRSVDRRFDALETRIDITEARIVEMPTSSSTPCRSTTPRTPATRSPASCSPPWPLPHAEPSPSPSCSD